MINFILATTFALSFVLTLTTIRFFSRFEFLGLDYDEKVQKFHSGAVVRMGGLPIFVSLITTSAILLYTITDNILPIKIIGSAFPVFCAGLREDLGFDTKPILRLFASFISGMIFISWSGLNVQRTELPFVDEILSSYALAGYFLGVIAIAGLTNGFNIIDGFNGLAVASGSVFFVGITFLAHQNGDHFIAYIAALIFMATLGFGVLNFPLGRIFLGDSGAYLIGYFAAVLAIVLHYNLAISPVALALLAAYPVVETSFSLTRKCFQAGKHPFRPDNLHLHMLVYRCLLIWHSSVGFGRLLQERFLNPLVTVVLSPLIVVPLVIVGIDERDSEFLMAAFLAYITIYLAVYYLALYFLTSRSAR